MKEEGSFDRKLLILKKIMTNLNIQSRLTSCQQLR